MGLCQSQESSGRRSGGSKPRSRKQQGSSGRKQQRKRRQETESSGSQGSESDDDEDSQDSHADQNNKQVQITTTKPAHDSIQNPPISQEDMDVLFYKASICESFADTPIPHEILRNAMKLALLAPSAYNCCPMRAVFISSPDGKQKLMQCTDSAETQRFIQDAPAIAIICTDIHYTRNLPKLMPYVPNAQQMFEQYDDLNEMIRIRNSNLQAGYLILAIRSLGMAVGPISDSLNTDKFDEGFLQSTDWRSSLLIPFGYAKDPEAPKPNSPRLSFDIAAKFFG